MQYMLRQINLEGRDYAFQANLTSLDVMRK